MEKHVFKQKVQKSLDILKNMNHSNLNLRSLEMNKGSKMQEVSVFNLETNQNLTADNEWL